MLAQRGFTANPDVLEAHKGFISTFYPDSFDTERLLGFGKPFRVVEPGLAIKLFPSQYGTHFAITAGLDLHLAINARKDIRRVGMVSPVMKYIDRPVPTTGLDGKFSLQYTLAAARLDGAVKIASFSDERRFRADMVELLGKIEPVQGASIPGDLHGMRVEVQIELDDGSTHSTTCRAPRGSWGMKMEPAEHEAKLNDCLANIVSTADGEQLLCAFDRLDQLDADAVRSLVSLMAWDR